MEVYTTEEQQVESLKKWWKENGRSVIAGVVLGLGGVLGWQAWVAHTASVGEQAAIQFDRLLSFVNADDKESAIKQAEALIGEYASTPYALFAAFAKARLLLETGDTAGARVQLEWALQRSEGDGLEQIARLRLGRILLNDGELELASNLVSGDVVESFRGEYAELRGDIAVARKEYAAAREAYDQALRNQVANAALVRMKRDDLPGESALNPSPES